MWVFLHFVFLFPCKSQVFLLYPCNLINKIIVNLGDGRLEVLVVVRIVYLWIKAVPKIQLLRASRRCCLITVITPRKDLEDFLRFSTERKKTNSKETEEETRKRNFKKNSVRVVHDLKTRSLHNSFRTVWSCYKKNYCGFTWRVEKVTLSNLTNQTNKFREPVTKKRKYMRTVLSLARENACDQVTIGSASSSDWLRIWCAVSKRITQ